MFLTDSVLLGEHLDPAVLKPLCHLVDSRAVADLIDTVLFGIPDAELVGDDITSFLEQAVQDEAQILSLLLIHLAVLEELLRQ